MRSEYDTRRIPPGRTRADRLEGEALDQHTLNWVNRINASGTAFMSPSKLDDGWMVRVSIGVESTTRAHIEKLWHTIQKQVERTE